MTLSPYYLIVALGCFAGAALMFTRFRREVSVSIPTGILLVLTGVYLLCGQLIKGFADNPALSWTARGVLVVFLIYLLLSYNDARAQQNAEFDAPQDKDSAEESTKTDTPKQ